MIKKLLPVMLVMFSATGLFAQTTPQDYPQSKIGEFLDRTGVLVHKQLIDVGFIRGVRVQTITATELFSGRKMPGVRFEAAGLGADAATRASREALIDSDELDDLIKTVEMLRSNVFNTFPEPYADVFYTSRDGFSIGGFFAERRWHAVIKIDKYDSNSPTRDMKPDDFNQLLDLLQQAKAKLK